MSQVGGSFCGSRAQFFHIQIGESQPGPIDVGLECLLMLTLLLVVFVPSLHAFLLLPYCVVPGLGGTHMICVPVVWWVDSTVVWPIEVALAVAGHNSTNGGLGETISACGVPVPSCQQWCG
jgi:hypothetical protein